LSGPSPLWYATRGLGLTLLVVLTATVVLGVVTSRRWRSERWPRFLTAALHRNLALLGLALLPLHGLTVILDPYARLGLTDVTVPFASTYRPLWMGLGVLAGELSIALVAVSLVRQRLGHRLWRLTHWVAYAVWPLALLHGSDTRFSWALLVYAACAAAVLLAVLFRLSLHGAGVSGWRVAAGVTATAGVVGATIWTMLGPLQPGWALAAGTPRDLLAATAPGPSPDASPPASLPAGLDDPLAVAVVRSRTGGRQVTFTDRRDPSLQITVTIDPGASSGPLEARSGDRVVCRAEAGLEDDITALCSRTRLSIQLVRGAGGLTGELTTEAA